jgi:hypothetical protein
LLTIQKPVTDDPFLSGRFSFILRAANSSETLCSHSRRQLIQGRTS